MKIGNIHLRYFKRFRDYELDFYDETGFPKDFIVLIGDNGTGKSSILQAIAMVVGSATNRLKNPTDLDWPGFDARLAVQNWRFPASTPNIECDIIFNSDELQATHEYFQLVGLQGATPPGKTPIVTLKYFADIDQVKADTAAEWFQFRGRDYAKQVYRNHPEGRNIFQKVGDIFWYTEHRTSTSLMNFLEENGDLSIDLLRQRLSEWENYHLKVGKVERSQYDLYAKLEEAYKNFFPERGFVGTVPRPPEEAARTSWFVLSDKHRQYEISEMSAGERALFPIIFDFANWSIHRSIVLIDEVELHLHPPLQQAFIQGLQKLGKDNQIIVTTHSESVLDIVPPSSVYRIGE